MTAIILFLIIIYLTVRIAREFISLLEQIRRK